MFTFAVVKPLLWLPFISVVLAGNTDTKPCTTATFDKLLSGNSNAHTLSAYRVPANGTFTPPASDVAYPKNATNLPALCAITVNVTSSPTSSYTFGLFLPDEWNDRFIAVGNGGFSGGINWYSMGSVVPYGFATVSTSTGHNSTGMDLKWGLNQPEAKIDWAYRALHGSIVLSKQITTAYYGSNLRYSYYAGCSTGGRQGLKEVQDFPDDFDGVIMGAPAWWSTHQQMWQLQVGVINLPENSSHYIPTSLFPIISDEVLRQCDLSDGVADRVIMDPKKCNFYPEALLCTSSTVNKSACLTPAQLNTLYRLYQPIIDVNDTWLYPNFGLGSEAQMPASFGVNNTPSLYGTEYVRYALNDPNWDWHNFDYTVWQKVDAIDPGNVNAVNFDLSAFHAHGGKLLHYHGLNDGLIPTGASRYLYKQILYAMNQKNITLPDWYRFFLIPGMQHCAGSNYDAPWYMGGAQTIAGVHSVPGYEDSKHDILLALMDWVEKGKAVDSMIVTKFHNDTLADSVVRQRPICPYPQQTVYDGHGDINVAGSWSCEPHAP